MKSQTLTPAEIFGYHVRYVVPMFQRRYVWTLEDQWKPLWTDVSRLAERLLEGAGTSYGANSLAPHFLGAVVLDQPLTATGYIAVRTVIDGQQRLTTLQLLLHATESVVQKRGADMDAQALKVLVSNSAGMAHAPYEQYKVWPTNRDQAAFRAAFGEEPTGDMSGQRLVQAHDFFARNIEEWAEVAGDDACMQRLNALTRVLRDHLKIVVIDLEPGDNAQVIFETLNDRGARLLAADLVKNLLFQLASTQKLDLEALYQSSWEAFDNDYWQKPVSQGRRYRPRVDTFLNYWLIMRTAREVPAEQVFACFRDYLQVEKLPVQEVMADLYADGERFAGIESLPWASDLRTFYYRVVSTMDQAVVGPFLLWLLRNRETPIPAEQVRQALGSVESWLVRRTLCRMTLKDLNRLIIDLIKELSANPVDEAGHVTERFFARQQADSRVWPTDEQVISALETDKIYTHLTRARLRMVLEALEDDMRGPKSEYEHCPRGTLTIEHVMPQRWQEYWGADVAGDPVATQQRDRAVHTLGNLTLVNGKLNPAMSNLPWTGEVPPGKKPKRDQLLEHSVLKLNAQIVAKHTDAWTEKDVAARSTDLARRVCATWPRPAAPVQTEQPEAGNGVVNHVGKYRALWVWLGEQQQDVLPLTFAEVEAIIGQALPPSSYEHNAHWASYEGSAVVRAIHDAGWKAGEVDLANKSVVLRRQPAV